MSSDVPSASGLSAGDSPQPALGLRSLVRQRIGAGQRPVILVAAFEGWNDAAEAATDVVKILCDQLGATALKDLTDEDYYDYQFTRPVVSRDEDGRGTLEWPSTSLMRAVLPPADGPDGEDPGLELLFVRGVEPSFRWRSFTAELLGAARERGVHAVLTLGALLADVPHTRPFPAYPSSSDPEVRDVLMVHKPTYEGPTGIVGVVTDTAVHQGLATVSAWVSVPHYVAQSPSPKAQLALLGRVEELLEITVDLGSLPEDAEAWERGVDELASSDPDVAAYVEQLEQARDTETLPEASGESIAREFERYLKRRSDGPGRGGSDRGGPERS